MRQVDADDFSANAIELTAALSAGDEVVVTMGGREYRLVPKAPPASDHRTPAMREQQRVAVEAAFALGQEVLRTRGPTTSAERRAWIEEARP